MECNVQPELAHSTAATCNACKLCTPLGACLVFRGVEGAIPFLHGSQGCSTYIRRYLISHFREPMDIAASNFSEETAVFGGAKNLQTGLRNVVRQYQPQMVGLATTCLSETIGEDMPTLVEDCRSAISGLPPVVHVSTASYRGSHIDGFHDAVLALVKQLVEKDAPAHGGINLLPGMVSAADLRCLRELVEGFGLEAGILPDYSETLDGATWADYAALSPGGIPVRTIRSMSGARATLELGTCVSRRKDSAGRYLERACSVPNISLPLPIGIRATDRFLKVLEDLSGCPISPRLTGERGRLVDSLVDAHKVVFGKRAVVFGEADLVTGLTAFLCEMGIRPVVCATGGKPGNWAALLRSAVPELPPETIILEGVDFRDIAAEARTASPDIFIGNSKGYHISRELNVPLIRTGFPIHDRIGAQRILHVGYEGAQRLFDEIANALLERKQEHSPIGYSYL